MTIRVVIGSEAKAFVRQHILPMFDDTDMIRAMAG